MNSAVLTAKLLKGILDLKKTKLYCILHYSCVYYSFPGAACLIMAMLDATKHIGLRNQTLFMGYSGQKYSEYVSIGCPKISQDLGRNSFRPPGVFWGTIDWKYIKI